MAKQAVSKSLNLAKFRSSLPKGGVLNSPSTRTGINVTKIKPLAKQKFGNYNNVLGLRGSK